METSQIIKKWIYIEQKTKMYITQKLYRPGEVNRATKQRDGDVLIYDRTKPDPLLTLKGHTMEG